MNEVRGHYATLFVEEGLTTTNGEDNRSRIMNQSEAVARSDNDCQKHSLTDKDQGSKQAQQSQNSDRQHDSLQRRATVQVVNPGNRTNISKGRLKRPKAKLFGSGRECSAGQNTERGLKKNNVHPRTKSGNRNKRVNHPLVFLLYCGKKVAENSRVETPKVHRYLLRRQSRRKTNGNRRRSRTAICRRYHEKCPHYGTEWRFCVRVHVTRRENCAARKNVIITKSAIILHQNVSTEQE